MPFEIYTPFAARVTLRSRAARYMEPAFLANEMENVSGPKTATAVTSGVVHPRVVFHLLDWQRHLRVAHLLDDRPQSIASGSHGSTTAGRDRHFDGLAGFTGSSGHSPARSGRSGH